jgi:hypothetical protein
VNYDKLGKQADDCKLDSRNTYEASAITNKPQNMHSIFSTDLDMVQENKLWWGEGEKKGKIS